MLLKGFKRNTFYFKNKSQTKESHTYCKDVLCKTLGSADLKCLQRDQEPLGLEATVENSRQLAKIQY